MLNMSQEVSQLKVLKENDIVEFHYQLRNKIKQSSYHNIDYFYFFIDSFYHLILGNGIFYIDVINEKYRFFFNLSLSDNQVHHIELLVNLLEKLVTICDKESLAQVKIMIRSLKNKNNVQKAKLQKIYTAIEENLLSIEEKLALYKLSPPKSIITHWY